MIKTVKDVGKVLTVFYGILELNAKMFKGYDCLTDQTNW